MIDPIIDDVIREISETCNPRIKAISVSDPACRDMVKDAFELLKAQGHRIYAADVEAAAIKHGWEPDEAKYLVKKFKRYMWG